MEKASIVVAHKSKEEVEVLYVGTDYAKALEVVAAEKDDPKWLQVAVIRNPAWTKRYNPQSVADRARNNVINEANKEAQKLKDAKVRAESIQTSKANYDKAMEAAEKEIEAATKASEAARKEVEKLIPAKKAAKKAAKKVEKSQD